MLCYYTMLFLYYIILYYIIILCYIILYYVILYYIVLYYIILYCLYKCQVAVQHVMTSIPIYPCLFTVYKLDDRPTSIATSAPSKRKLPLGRNQHVASGKLT